MNYDEVDSTRLKRAATGAILTSFCAAANPQGDFRFEMPGRPPRTVKSGGKRNDARRKNLAKTLVSWSSGSDTKPLTGDFSGWAD